MFYDTICLVGFDYKWQLALSFSVCFMNISTDLRKIRWNVRRKISFVRMAFSLSVAPFLFSVCRPIPMHRKFIDSCIHMCSAKVCKLCTRTQTQSKNINKWDKIITKPIFKSNINIEHRSYAEMFTIYLFSNLENCRLTIAKQRNYLGCERMFWVCVCHVPACT